MEMTVEKLEREIDRMIMNTNEERLIWLKTIIHTHSVTIDKIKSAKCEYDVLAAYADYANCLIEAGNEIKKLGYFRRALHDVQELISPEEENKNDD